MFCEPGSARSRQLKARYQITMDGTLLPGWEHQKIFGLFVTAVTTKQRDRSYTLRENSVKCLEYDHSDNGPTFSVCNNNLNATKNCLIFLVFINASSLNFTAFLFSSRPVAVEAFLNEDPSWPDDDGLRSNLTKILKLILKILYYCKFKSTFNIDIACVRLKSYIKSLKQ